MLDMGFEHQIREIVGQVMIFENNKNWYFLNFIKRFQRDKSPPFIYCEILFLIHRETWYFIIP
jgi:hypothetical protein